MRVSLDARAVGPKTCGVSRYARELVAALGRADSTNEYIVYTERPAADLLLPENFRLDATGCSRMNPMHDVRMAAIVRRDRPSVYHVLHAWLPVVLPAGVTAILTVHDVFAVTDREFFAKRRPLDGLARAYFRWLISRSLRRARAVIANSEYSKSEIRRVFPAANVPIVVTHLAPYRREPDSPGRTEPAGRIGRPYVLYVGNFRSYKNVDTLIKAFAEYLRAAGPGEIVLVLAGSDTGDRQRRLAAELGISHAVRFVHRPSDERLQDLYRGALALVQPSLHEGFGLPPLEAMSAGVPVIISDAEGLREVCGDAARVFRREDVGALADELSTVVGSPHLREQMSRAGRVQAGRYSWEATAGRTLGVYRWAAGGASGPLEGVGAVG